MAQILIVDDDPALRRALGDRLRHWEHAVEEAVDLTTAREAVTRRAYDLVLLDLQLPDGSGLDFLRAHHDEDAELPVVVLTAHGSIESAVEAVRAGAVDFLSKPVDFELLRIVVERTLERTRLARANRALAGRDGAPEQALVAHAPVTREVLALAAQAARSRTTILITGENGSGKGLVARALHEHSPREAKPLVTVNMGGLSEGVFESELFGHVKGAFTDAKADRVGRFELAQGGTLFLDEIANIPPRLQTALLRVIETGEFERVGSSKTQHADVRMISATNARLDQEVAAGRFRQDLLFRLNTVEILLPPLRERREDIPALAAYFLAQHAQRYRKNLSGLELLTLQVLQDHAWPGNVRELDHVIERAALMAQGTLLKPTDLSLRTAAEAVHRLEDMSLEEVERFLIKKTLARCAGNARQAAELLGLSRSAFYRRVEKYGL